MFSFFFSLTSEKNAILMKKLQIFFDNIIYRPIMSAIRCVIGLKLKPKDWFNNQRFEGLPLGHL